MLGSRSEAEDAVQETWLRLNRAEADDIANPGGFLTTVVARICLDMLRARKSRREEELDDAVVERAAASEAAPDHEIQLADSIGLAMLVVLETLSPAERVAFVLHDMFDLSFDAIAPIVGRSPVAARQLASRARRRVQGSAAVSDTGRDRQREVVNAFRTASREGDFSALLAVLDPDIVMRADPAAVSASLARQAQGAPPVAPEARGAETVAGIFAGRARAARLAVINGAMGLVYAPGGVVLTVFGFTIARDRIVAIDITADPARIAELEIEIFR
jgi:RNA polymerase sigma-70 factor (ECF subfamily)